MDLSIIFYPSGYLQLQVSDDGDDFCHIYDNAHHLAKDVCGLLNGDNAIGWYGNDPDAWLDIANTPNIHFVSNAQIEKQMKHYCDPSVDKKLFWDNEAIFYAELKRLLDNK